MNQTFDITRSNRKALGEILKSHTLEQLNHTPPGFNNNIIWNVGHIIVVQQMLVYNLSGLPMMISNEMIAKYKRGTKPETLVAQAEISEMQLLLFETIDQTKTDFQDKIFKDFNEYVTMTGFVIRNAEDALAFNYFHEAVHLGMILSLRKFV